MLPNGLHLIKFWKHQAVQSVPDETDFLGHPQIQWSVVTHTRITMHNQKKGETIFNWKPFVRKKNIYKVKIRHCDDCWVIKVIKRLNNLLERRQLAAWEGECPLQHNYQRQMLEPQLWSIWVHAIWQFCRMQHIIKPVCSFWKILRNS